MGVLVVLYLWKNIGYNLILFLAGLRQIPRDYPYDRIYMLQHYMNSIFAALEIQKLTV